MGCNCNQKAECVVAGSTVVVMAHVVTTANANVTQAVVSGVRVDLYDVTDSRNVYPVNSSGTAITDGSAYATPSKTTVISDTLLTDSRWTRDSVGYNVSYATAMPVRDRLYDLRITITLTSGDAVVVREPFSSR